MKDLLVLLALLGLLCALWFAHRAHIRTVSSLAALAARNVMFDLLPQAVVLLDQQRRVLDCNGMAQAMAFSLQVYKNQPFELALTAWLDLNDGGMIETEHERFLLAFRDGRKRCYQIVEQPMAMGDAGYGRVIIIHDVSAMHHMLEAVREEANHDPLTGLPNRRAFEARGGELMLSLMWPFTVVLADLDLLKHINDTWGHAVGDEALCRVAALLEKRVPPSAMAARIGGDEFAVLLPTTTAQQAHTWANEIREAIKKEPLSAGHSIALSIGFAEVTGPEQSLQGALAQADQQLYAQKAENHKPAALRA